MNCESDDGDNKFRAKYMNNQPNMLTLINIFTSIFDKDNAKIFRTEIFLPRFFKELQRKVNF